MASKNRIKTTMRKPRNTKKNFAKGTMSINWFFIFLSVLLIFLGFMFVIPDNTVNEQQRNETVEYIPPINDQFETGGGLETFDQLDPLLQKYQITQRQCRPITNDIVLVFDRSGSMRGSKLDEAKLAASLFVYLITSNPQSRISLITFSDSANLDISLSNDKDALLKQIEAIENGRNTCIQCGVTTANQEITKDLRDGVKRSAVLFSDGKANHINGNKTDDQAAKDAALSEAIAGFTASNTNYFTISIGDDADRDFMSRLALSTQGIGLNAVNESEFTQSFAEAAAAICQPQ